MGSIRKTFHDDIYVIGDIIGQALNVTSAIVSTTLYVGGKITGAADLEIATTAWIKGNTTVGEPAVGTATLTVYGMISLPAGGFTTGLVMEKALDIDIGASTEFDINDGLFRFSDGTNTLRVDDSNGIQLLGRTGVGATVIAGYQFYVHDDDVTGTIAKFHTEFSGDATVEIDARINYDAKLRFMEGGTVKWQIGNDESASTFNIRAGTGLFDATDVLRLSNASTQTLYTGNTMLFYVKAGIGTSSVLIQAAAGADSQLMFREDVTSHYTIGHDFGDSLFKIRAGSSISGTYALAVDSSDRVLIPDLGVTGGSFNINGSFTMDTAGPGTGGVINLKNGFGSIYNATLVTNDANTNTLITGVFHGGLYLLLYGQRNLPPATEVKGVYLIQVMDDDTSGTVRLRTTALGTTGTAPTISYANDNATSCDITVKVSSVLNMRWSLLRIG